MESWEKFANVLQLTKELEENYLKMRKFFQKEGWTEYDLKNPPYFTEELMRLHSNFAPKVQEIIQTIKDYGFNVDGTEVHHYIMDKLSHIDDITPLRKPNGNNKRND
jgi:hypothetical protein